MIANIQSLRFIAAFWVFLFHFKETRFFPKDIEWLNKILGMGFSGVDIFFVISGYVMSIAAEKTQSGPSPAARFFALRLGRIYSGWWPYFIIYLLTYKFTIGIRGEVNIPGSIFLLPLYLQQYLVPIIWTLSFELYFYLGVALIISINRRIAGRLMLAAGLIVSLSTLIFYRQGIYSPDGVSKATLLQYFYLCPVILNFIAGFLLGEFKALHKKTFLIPAIAITLITGWLAYRYHNSGTLYPSGLGGFYHAPERAILIGTGASALILSAVLFEKMGYTPMKWAQKLGDASYSLYLGHIFLMAAITEVSRKYFADRATEHPVLWATGTALAVLFISWCYHVWIEAPLHRKSRAFINHRFEKRKQALA